jgi:hypothetical protein
MCASSVIFQKTSQSKLGVSSPNLATLPTWNGTAMTNFVTNWSIIYKKTGANPTTSVVVDYSVF